MVVAAVLGAASAGAGCALIAGLSPHEPYPPDGVVQITAGLDHACALTRGGKVWCWGANDTGQLGRNAIVDGGACTTACPPVEVDGISSAVQVSAGAGFTCAVEKSGVVMCWGRDDTGQLGRVTTVTCKGGACDPVPDVATGVHGAVQVSAGGGYACARTGDGGVVCWGADTYGELGTGVLAAQSVPQPVGGIGATIDVSAALVGSNTCIAASDGGVWCWGLDRSGGVGHAPDAGNVEDSDGGNPCTLRPAPVKGVAGAVAVTAGGYGACAQTDSSGFWCWGYDGIGCLGAGDAGPTVELPPGRVTVLLGISALALRDSTACGIDADGGVWCWGQSGVGAIGRERADAAICDQGVACQREALFVGIDSVTQLAAGARLSVALRADGTVWAWGVNDDGQLGHPPDTQGDAPCPAAIKSTCNPDPHEVTGLPH